MSWVGSEIMALQWVGLDVIELVRIARRVDVLQRAAADHDQRCSCTLRGVFADRLIGAD
jgi:hypothetical protein